MNSLQPDILRQLALELLRRQPAVFADMVNGQIGAMVVAPPEPRHEPPPPENESPNWCNLWSVSRNANTGRKQVLLSNINALHHNTTIIFPAGSGWKRA